MAESTGQNVAQAFKEYKWYNSLSLPVEVQVGVHRLELPIDIPVNSMDIPKDIYFTAHIICNQTPMHEAPVSTHFCYNEEARNALIWDYVLNFPLKIRDLSLDSLLILNAWTSDGKIFGGTNIRLFDENGSFKRGKQKLLFYFGVKADTNVTPALNKTPGEYYDHYAQWDHRFQAEKLFETYRSAQQSPQQQTNEGKLEWLDRLTLARLQSCMNHRNLSTSTWDRPLEEIDLETFCFLVIELPILPHPVLHEEKQYPSVPPHIPPTSLVELLGPYIVESEDSNSIEFSLVGQPFNAACLTIVADWDMDQENLSEEQNRRLSHNARRGAVDASGKPNKAERELIGKILRNVGNMMTIEEIDLLHRFRYSLTDHKRGLIKFLYAVNWDEESEVAEVPKLLALWKEKAPIEIADALKLLSREKAFEHPLVREYAVGVLRTASDEELLTFLLQLVQALRYEPSPSVTATLSSMPPVSTDATIMEFPLEKSMIGVGFGSPVDPNNVTTEGSVETPAPPVPPRPMPVGPNVSADNLSPLAVFLIDRACSSTTVANFLYWYLKVEMDDEQSGYLFNHVFEAFIVQLSTSGPENKLFFKRLMALNEYISQISLCQRNAREQGKRKEGKELCLIKLLEERQLSKIPSSGVDWVPLPLDPSICLTGLIPSTATMFASAVYPCVIEFIEAVDPAFMGPAEVYKRELKGGNEGVPQDSVSLERTLAIEGMVKKEIDKMVKPTSRTHKIMFKSGDDLRQDQLIMQMISLMDRLLKKVNLDLKLLTYGILAVGQKDGIMEFVRNSMPISAILKNHGSITEFLRHNNPDKSGPYEMSPLALDTFVKSCAGCCVITYILGIGDRHLDNIMVNKVGQMFHIDFGFIFGQDPKPLPPPFRFTRAMADAMGGEDSEHYARFKTFCCQSYNWLRKSANLILNLLSLMGDAGIQDISKRSDLSKVLLKVEEKFRLDLTDEQAEQFFLGLINESLHSLAPRLMEVAHKIAVSLR